MLVARKAAEVPVIVLYLVKAHRFVVFLQILFAKNGRRERGSDEVRTK